jgi:pimeloyl-ACP methyl ester carboxylesterase
MIEFAQIQDSLAKLGIRSIAVDTPGYGMSDEPPGNPTLKDLADNLVPVLDGLRLSKAVVAGHHTGASIAVSFAANHQDRVTAVILHGMPLFNEQELAERINRKPYDRTPLADGSHLSRLFQGKSATAQSPEALRNRTYALISMFNLSRDLGHHAVYQYQAVDDAKAIRVPGLLITDVTDPLHVMDDRMATLRPDFRYVEFATKAENLDLMSDPEKWARIVADFAATFVK